MHRDCSTETRQDCQHSFPRVHPFRTSEQEPSKHMAGCTSLEQPRGCTVSLVCGIDLRSNPVAVYRREPADPVHATTHWEERGSPWGADSNSHGSTVLSKNKSVLNPETCAAAEAVPTAEAAVGSVGGGEHPLERASLAAGLAPGR